MVETIFILDPNKNVIGQLSNNGTSPSAPFFDDMYISELSNGSETYEFSTVSNSITNDIISLGNHVVFKYDDKYKMFQIMDTEESHSDGEEFITCYCEMAGLELLTDYCEPFKIEGNVVSFFNTVLQDTNWQLGMYSSSLVDNIQTVKNETYNNVYKIIQENIPTFGNIEIEYRVNFENNRLTGYFIDVFSNEGRGNKTYKRFEYGENVSGVVRKRNLNDFASAMIGVGKDNLTFKDVVWSTAKGDPADKPAGQDFIVDIEANNKYNKSGRYIKGLFEDSEITNGQDLLLKTWEKLQEVKEPKFDYEIDISLVSDEYSDVMIGDTVYVADFDYNPPMFLEARVGKLELSFSDPTKNKCTLSNYKEIASKIREVGGGTSDLDEAISKYFPIDSDKILNGAITEGKIDPNYVEVIKTNVVDASMVITKELIAESATILDAKIENLTAKDVIIEGTLEAVNATIEKLTAKDVIIEGGLEAANGHIHNLTSDLAKINTLINGNLTSDNIHSLILTSDKVTVENGFITNAMIKSLIADKITGGSINTNNVSISSSDGSLQLNGTLQQFRDQNGIVRIQMGKDSQGNFTFGIFDSTGKGTLIDANGITEKAIGQGIIVDNMISDNAMISGDKIDISSVITNINNNNETSINASSITYDGKKLDVSFNELKTKVETIENITIDGDLSSVIEQVTTNTTNIGIAQGQISQLISDTTITKENGQTVSLKDVYNSVKNTVDTHTQTIGSLESTVKTVDSKQSKLEQDLSGFKTTVFDTYTTKEELNNLNIGTRNLLKLTDSEKSITGTNTANQSMTLYHLSDPSLMVGKKVTLSFTYQVSNYTSGYFKIQTANNVFQSFKTVTPSGNGTFTYTSTITMTSETGYTNIQIRLDNFNGTVKILANTAILVVSDKAADWTPAPEDLRNDISKVEQTANKINWVVASGDSSSNMSLTSDAYNVISKNISLTADRINLNGYVSNDNANWSIDNQGNMNSKNMAIEGELSADTITCNKINNPNYPESLSDDLQIYVNASTGSDDIELEEGAVFKTINGALDALPRNLNNYTAKIMLQTDTTENVTVRNINTGRVMIQLNGKTLKGYIDVVQNMGLQCFLYGGTKGDASDSRGKVMPSIGTQRTGGVYTVAALDTFSFTCYNVDFYAPTVNQTYTATENNQTVTKTYAKAAIHVSNFTRAYINNVKVYHTLSGTTFNTGFDNFIRTYSTAYVYIAESYGLTKNYAYFAQSGSQIRLNHTEKQVGRYNSTSVVNTASGGEVYYISTPTWDGAGTTGSSNASTSTPTQTVTKTFKSNYGDTYRHTVYNNFKKDGTCRQGTWGYGNCSGAWFFGTQLAQVKGKNITKIQITIKRQEGGNSSAVDLAVKTHNYTARPSTAPSYGSSCGTLSLKIGETKTLTITNSTILNALKNGSFKGFGIQAAYTNGNYAVCSGSATVKVTYTE